MRREKTLLSEIILARNKTKLVQFSFGCRKLFFLPKTERMTEIMATNTVLTKSQLFLVHESQPLVNELQLRKKIEKSILRK